MEDQQILQLIKIAVIDESRKELYRDSLPKMTAEEKLQLLVGLWEMWMEQLNLRMNTEMESMVAEMADKDKDVVYEKKDFQDLQSRMVDEMLKERVGVEEEDQLGTMRRELDSIHDIVQSHDQDLSEIKSKLE